jgi:hypothetical protein
MSPIDAAALFVKQMEKEAPTPARLTEAEGLLETLAAVRWENASPEDREAGWKLTLRLTLLTQTRIASRPAGRP